MNEQTSEGPQAAEGSGGADRDQPEAVMESQEGQEEPGREMEQRWEAQWQEFLKTLEAPHSTWEMHQLSEDTPWEDAKAFLASFEQVAAACRWPRGEWVARLLPALSGEAQQAFSLLAARDKEDYGKVKATILRGDALRREVQRQHFRQFCCQQLGDPRRMYNQLQELCCQWLKPERHTKEQILELLILEQFLASLPVDIQSWIQAGGPDDCAQAVALLEDFLLSQRESDTGTWQEPMQEWALGPLEANKEFLGTVQEEISTEQAERFRGTQQNANGEVTVPEGQDMAETELRKVLGVQLDQVTNPSKTGGTLHVVEQTPMQSSQQTMFWKVLQEEDENVDSLDDGKGTQLKVRSTQLGGNEPVETLRRGQERTQEDVPMTVQMREERCEPNSRQRTEPVLGSKESDELPEGRGAACNNPSPADTDGEKASFSKYGRRSTLLRHKQIHTRKKPPHKCPECGKRFRDVTDLSRHLTVHTGKRPHQCPQCEKSFSQRSALLRHQNIHGCETIRTFKQE
ncbi:zinc finger and SCAN domain-containing protein 16-like [Tiliqua scincoides]|uniref:zinc finger and SCAN domain-containing protein 16-like n=1 Tax=Tiliqua scincoides TaxID=71010 RepID=UPI003461F770